MHAGGTQLGGHLARFCERRRRELARAKDARLTTVRVRVSCGGELGVGSVERQDNGGQCLANAVMELAREARALLLVSGHEALARLAVELRVVARRGGDAIGKDGHDHGDGDHQRPLGELDLLLRRRHADCVRDRDVDDHHAGCHRDAPEGRDQAVEERADGDDQPQALEQDLRVGQSQEQPDREQPAREVHKTAQQYRVQVSDP